MDFNNSPLLTIIKEEQDITIVKTEFDSNLDLYNYCPNCGHQFATKFVGSDFVFSKPDVSNLNGVPESSVFEPVVNIEIDESNINNLLSSNIQWWAMDVSGKLDRNVLQTDNVARAIYNQGLRDGCKLLNKNNEHKLVERKCTQEPAVDYTKCHFESPVMGLPVTNIIQCNDNKKSTILSSVKRKLIKKKCQPTEMKTDDTQNVPVWNDFTLDQEMPYLPLPALKLMSGAEQMYQNPNISQNKTSSRVNVKPQTKCTIPFQSVSSPSGIVNDYTILCTKKLCNTVINKNESFQKEKFVIPLTAASLLKEIDIS
ncbi:uncharacterized protein LOC126845592 isoform X2 [Adelges cooleyi]|uniref:uncharacterized protein LOC126845592 isoform X2 n=1 Tax=Adelges cooleyi TaxID=133065 RepID=UPI0021807FC5|nr:uncharacterized protein LOC126845592 isoform X2 [Adelges cooleyi]